MPCLVLLFALWVPCWLCLHSTILLEHCHPPGTANPIPLIAQPLIPDAVAPGGIGFTLTLNGTGFVPGAVVKWNGSARATVFVNTSQLTATILAADIALTNTASVTVVNPSPGGGLSNVIFFQITLPSSSVDFHRSDFPVSRGPSTCATGDFNRDGNLDLAVATEGGMSVSVLLGQDDGTFVPSVDYALGEQVRWVLTADFNRDGKLDLAAGGETSSVIAVLLGNGDGTFQMPVEYGTGVGPFWAISADFNGDGKLDLATANFIDNTVSILLGEGDGSFPTHIDFRTGVGPFWVVTGDFNRDNRLDLATANWFGNTISVLLGNGDGTFAEHVDYAESINPRSMVTTDLNHDGKLDFAIANEGSGTVGIMLGNGDGTFQNPTYYTVKGGPAWVDAADMNADGNVDLLVSHYTHGMGKTVTLLRGIGDGTFHHPLSYRVKLAPESSAIGDFNGDGRLDVAVAAGGANAVSVRLQVPTHALESHSGATITSSGTKAVATNQ